MPSLVYGSRWHTRLKLMLDPVTEQQAREMYEQGLEVTIASGPDELTVEVPDDFDLVGVQPADWSLYTELTRTSRNQVATDVVVLDFYNFWGTRDLTFYFDVVEPGRLFLGQVSKYEFADMTQQVDEFGWSKMTEHVFRPDGYSSVTVGAVQPDGSKAVEMTEYSGGDFIDNWEPVPAWGDWASITRQDRSQPA